MLEEPTLYSAKIIHIVFAIRSLVVLSTHHPKRNRPMMRMIDWRFTSNALFPFRFATAQPNQQFLFLQIFVLLESSHVLDDRTYTSKCAACPA